LRVQSSGGRGTCLSIELPALIQPAAEDVEPDEEKQESTESEGVE